ncbi:hypothetical protein JAAARDRAFT_50033 [Jaapia argillacea MUCL 33604]|uniref:D-arabinono-1,4-lactone oxidase n=1 Tax=Jaapia argillacea MUCL 33604 TaxID=933084 RepID=A0A067PRU8_9AGAM|nr:hypothetical protein JAAARDRAFT_50033 [Jaapia argillacea MUCL 33604]
MADVHPNLAPLSELDLNTIYRRLDAIRGDGGNAGARFSNWARTYSCRPAAIFEPRNEDDCRLVVELGRREGKTVRAVGVGHSPSDLACTDGYLVKMGKLNQLVELQSPPLTNIPAQVNEEKKIVVSQPGITLSALRIALEPHNLALPNVGSIAAQTLAGAVATATHGSGLKDGVISSHVLSLTILLSDGSEMRCSKTDHSDLFYASLCGLGSTGIILELELSVEEKLSFKDVRFSTSFDHAVRDLEELAHSSQYTRMWWFPQTNVVQVSLSDPTSESKKPQRSWSITPLIQFHLTQFLLLLGLIFPVFNLWAGYLVSWFVRGKTVTIDEGHKIFNLDYQYLQHTLEFALPISSAPNCLRDLRTYFDKEHKNPYGLRPHFPVEIRFSEEDEIWLSPSYGRRTCWIGIAQYKPFGFDVPHEELFSNFTRILLLHDARPHWAKAHNLGPGPLRKLFPHFDDFVETVKKYDPIGMFRNEYVERHILSGS